MHQNALDEGKTDKKEIELKGFLQALIRVIPTIFKHKKFTECGENQDRASAHMMVLYAFIGLFVVTNIFFVVLYVFHIPGPYSQLNPVKWLANLSGVALVIGSAMMIKSRLDKKDQSSTFKDWAIIGLVLALGVTGLMTEMARLAGSAFISYFMYYLHLISIFMLFIYIPYSKLAHIVYRTVAMAYAEYGNRK
jgi:quinone-modifying oxidoreductase subunit QmoC